jgi:octaheme c-type cytochrome (tetrathionate reductase family)
MKSRTSLSMRCWQRVVPVLTAAVFCLALAGAAWSALPEEDYGAAEARRVTSSPKHWITTDHGKHPVLRGDLKSGPEVTAACLSCHNEASHQVQQTIHWTWRCPHDPNDEMGKHGITLNNFCIAVPSNEPRCTSCHAGYGWEDGDFMETATQVDVDCLVCHDTTGTYKKFPSGAGFPAKEPTKFDGELYLPPDWRNVAQNVGLPGKENCGSCHFYGGGGDAVKHGDLDSSLLKPTRELDVHMSADGADFDCVRCHTTDAHAIAGRCYKHPAVEDPEKSLIDDDQMNRISCVSCHTMTPHKPGVKANDHTDKVACQTCHIPTFARELATKTWWDWSVAGDKNRGVEKDEDGNVTYDPKKGEFVWEKFVEPVYHWFDGGMSYVLLTDEINPEEVVRINSPDGDMSDPNARIYPFKVHRGLTPYDVENKTMVVPHLFPLDSEDKTAYWKNFDWEKAIAHGQAEVGLPFSGEVGFVQTEYHYPTTHMVAPKEDSLECAACHSRDGRLNNLAGFYMPGRDTYAALDTFGWLLVFGSLAGVVGHGVMRKVLSSKKG